MQPHVLLFLDDDWVHDEPDTDIRPPLFMTHTLVDYLKACIARNIVVSLNLGIYQDGTVSPEIFEQMLAIRRAIKGN